MITVSKPAVRRWAGVECVPEVRSALRAVRGLARAVLAARRPAVVPLVLHGGPGTGKTHLTTALLARLGRGPGAVTARTVSAGDLARLAATGNDPGFADPDLLACDVLVLEDVHLLPVKDAPAVCALLDRRASRHRAVVVTANAGPAGLGHLPRALTSRLAAGLVVQLNPPSAPSRRVILEAAAAARRVRLAADALDWLAGQPGGLRAALGLLQNLAQVAPAYPGPLDRTAVAEVLAGTGQPTSRGPDVGEIVKRVAAAFGVRERDLLGASRLRPVLAARQVAMYLARSVGGLSLPRIGAAFGRDHSTVLHACRKVEGAIAADAGLAGLVSELRAVIG